MRIFEIKIDTEYELNLREPEDSPVVIGNDGTELVPTRVRLKIMEFLSSLETCFSEFIEGYDNISSVNPIRAALVHDIPLDDELPYFMNLFVEEQKRCLFYIRTSSGYPDFT